MTTYIQHFGILGMKWGRHKTQTSDPSINKSKQKESSSREVVREKGELLNHVTSDANLNLSNRFLYTSFTEKDRLRYQGEYADQVRFMRNVEVVFDYDLVAAEKLISPSKKLRIDTMIDMHKNDPNIVKTMAKDKVKSVPFLMAAKFFGFDVVKKKTKEYRKLMNSKNPKDQEKVLHTFSQLLMVSDKTRDSYFSRLKKQGFNSIYDDNDILAGYSEKPLIVFDSKKSLRIVKRNTSTQADTDKVNDLYTKKYG